MINKLKIRNFKCFEELDVELSNLNVFAGINSMGKSSVIQAILLLRQSYEMGTISSGLHLNGSLIELGTGFDLMNRDSNEDIIRIGVLAENKELFWNYIYNKDSDYQELKETNFDFSDEFEINIFKPSFCYISAERIDRKSVV